MEKETKNSVREWTDEDERKYRKMLATPLKKLTEQEQLELAAVSPHPPLGASKKVKSLDIDFDKLYKERVNHPAHYQHPSGVECITVARHHDFNIGNALKYLWRAGRKSEDGISDSQKQIEDLEKAVFYIKDEIEFLKSKQQ